MARGINTSIDVVALGFSFLMTVGCASHPNDEQLKQQAAHTTQQVKQNAEQAAATARVAAAAAEDKINAVAAGVKEGWQNGQSPAKVDLNTASRDRLVTLPGISPARAARIIAGRPYAQPGELVDKKVLTQAQFDRISGRIKVVPAGS
jgi:DNA uptake protein ComE-like DNA-binding protein